MMLLDAGCYGSTSAARQVCCSTGEYCLPWSLEVIKFPWSVCLSVCLLAELVKNSRTVQFLEQVNSFSSDIDWTVVCRDL